MVQLYQSHQIREIEKLAIDEGIDSYQLMLSAGEAAFKALLQRWPGSKAIHVFCGKGNNGGDGLVLAYLAKKHGLVVSVSLMSDPDQFSELASKALNAAQAAGVKFAHFDPHAIIHADVIVDALLGIGLSGEIQGIYQKAIATVNTTGCPVLALDIPSGINADTGDLQGCAIKADLTVTFIGLKQGLYTAKAPAYCGEIICDGLGISEKLYCKIKPTSQLMSWCDIRPFLPKRHRDTHKGTYGHLLVVGGDYGMGGAVRMAAEAAALTGAGLVTVATRPEHVPIVSGSRPELMCHQAANAEDLEPLLERATVVLVGPGLGKTAWAESLLNKILETNIPKVLDADSLNLLSQSPRKLSDWILTPHPGEAARLLDISCQEVQHNRFKAIQTLQSRYDGVIVLKGAGTLVMGRGDLIKICPAGNPGMATGGMGDVLSGIIGGLLAQSLALQVAAEAGVFIHSVAADRAAEEGGERGLLATDLLPYLRALVNPDWSSAVSNKKIP